MKWITYKSPTLYELSLRLYHGRKNLEKRYAYIAKNIKKGSSVLDIGCGTGLLGEYVQGKCNYNGIDLNESFISYASKKGLHVSVQDIFDFKKYTRNFDVIVICDILHHIYPKHKLFLEKIENYTNKIIICEPYDSYEKVGELSIFGKLMSFLVFLDSDGYNPINVKLNKRWWYNKKGLKNFFKESLKNSKSLKMKSIGSDIIAVYNFKN